MKCSICGSKDVREFKDGTQQGFCPVCNAVVDLEQDSNSVKGNMQVFFSYGHDNNAEFVKQLRDAIQKKTDHRITVWIDTEGIHEGVNWRSAIIEAIDKSDSVLAFLSSYSAREKGVCLDELGIAIASKHGMLRSVLLEKPDDNFTPPAVASEYQWADFSDYKEVEKKGGSDWEEYVSTKADQIIALLDSDEITEYNAEIVSIREKLLLPRIPGELSKFDRLIATQMVGRQWLFERVEKWRMDPDGKRIMVIYGKPGSGKSMFSAHLQYLNPNIAASIACDWQSDEFSDTDNIITWIAYKMALRIQEYRQNLLRLLNDGHFKLGTGKDRFKKLIVEPLKRTINGEHEKMIILIDSMDEAIRDLSEVSANNKNGKKQLGFIDFIKEYADEFPEWIRFLITSRREPGIVECFEKYLTLDFDAPECEAQNNDDLNGYYELRLNTFLNDKSEEEKTEFYNRLTDSSEGVFTYAECVCNEIISDIEKNGNIELRDYPLPKGLYELFLYTFRRREFCWFDGKEKLNYQGFWQIPLGMILSSPEPLPIDILKKWMGWTENEYRGFKRQLTTMLCEENGCIKGFHRSLGEWLDSESADEYMSSKADGIENLARKCYADYKEAKSNSYDVLGNYVLINLAYLLKLAGLDVEFNAVKNDIFFMAYILNKAHNLSSSDAIDFSYKCSRILVQTFEDDTDLDGCKIKMYAEMRMADALFSDGSKESREEAIKLLQHTLKSAEEIFGKDSQVYLSTCNSLAGMFIEKGNKKEALKLLEDIYTERMRDDSGSSEESKLESINNLGYGYSSVGDNEKALELYTRAYEGRVKVLGEDHADTLASLSNVAYSYGELGNIQKSIEINRRVYEANKRKSKNGGIDKDTLDSLNNLAYQIGSIGNNEEALALFQQAYEGYKKLFGEDYPMTITCLDNITGVLEEMGNDKECLELTQKSYEIKKRVFGDNDSDTIRTKKRVDKLKEKL